MVRFSCFNGHIHSHKSKTTAEQSMEAMLKALQDSTKVQDGKTSAQATSLNSVILRSKTDTHINYASEGILNSGEIEQTTGVEVDAGICRSTPLKRCKSLGDELCHEVRLSYNYAEEETDQEHNGSGGADSRKEREGSPTSQYDKTPRSESAQVGSDIIINGSVFSAGDSHQSNKEVPESSGIQLYGDGAHNSVVPTPPRPTRFQGSRSSPSSRSASVASGAHSRYLSRKSKSSGDLRGLDMGSKDLPVHEVGSHDKEINDGRSEGNNFENSPDYVYDSYDYSSPAKDWVMPVADEEENLAEEQLGGGGSSVQQPGEYPNEDFRFRRIEAWVNDLHSCGPVDEAIVLPGIDELVSSEPTVLGRPTVAKVDDKMTPSMEAAKRYISSLNPSTTTAQLSSHGLAVIPALGAFGSLRVLNLSGNSIARITAGVLPRGLHMLNLAKNNISTIEGLRELTRLRVLDLSYNRIFRIGHGLGSCSSLKELYLAGNKISEVEGLHRLLKLTVLDLRFNKLSTTKCLGQLAANYSSLQAISLEGNPAQKNVGDEQLKKHLQGLLPHLVYFNRQATKAGTIKDTADRAVRLGISSHHVGARLDNKSVRKASHGGLVASRALSSSTHGRASISSPKRAKGKHVKLPPSGTSRPSSHSRPQNVELSSRLVDFRAELAMRRSKSDGNLGPPL
ncbi:Protein phosphatase 1 regulatory subunit 7 [Linum perenne]